MALKTATAREETEGQAAAADGPLMDGMASAVKKMLARGKERGYLTYDDINSVMPLDQVSSEQIEDTLAILSEMGINVIESEESDDSEDGDSEGKTVHDKMAERVYTLIEEFEKYTVRHRPDGAKVVLTISIIEG